ncbi:MAG TPA: maleylpyruvate isomerase family mycothiol-dependent enzyme [Nocardioides sp.]|uniref:maleylpyruvate isomerase family mycothiol-dependent enzyme n=1 Tax=Nocardioides sp. TaxID=35761 RepID=UPI002BD89D72|nr:maleylpyruvate isomerase family mycothiol-dependent enzyme [Nocardioides sp.]HTW16293.1 maleylpyruvate isomerase family mycothiol-dependent enzyme [Nocardioides sp.]
MDENIWERIREERLSLARMLAPLTAEQWATPSLCAEWTVRDVVAHLAMTPAGEPRPWPMAVALVRARGHLWCAGRDVARDYARRPTAELVASLERSADSRRKPLFVNDANILLDLVVHGQDVAVPLGVDRPVPAAAAAFTLERIWSMGWPFHARRRLAGVRFRAAPETPAGWAAGEGPEVRGTPAALALLMTGRTAAALPMLHGPGVARLADRLDVRREPRAG